MHVSALVSPCSCAVFRVSEAPAAAQWLRREGGLASGAEPYPLRPPGCPRLQETRHPEHRSKVLAYENRKKFAIRRFNSAHATMC